MTDVKPEGGDTNRPLINEDEEVNHMDVDVTQVDKQQEIKDILSMKKTIRFVVDNTVNNNMNKVKRSATLKDIKNDDEEFLND